VPAARCTQHGTLRDSRVISYTFSSFSVSNRPSTSRTRRQFFRSRFDRLTPAEKSYLRAMPELGPGPHRSGDIADQLGKKVTTIAPVRNSLMTNGMIYSRLHGDTAFTVPLLETGKNRGLREGRS